MNYTYTYDDSPITSRRNHLWWQASVTQAGLVLDGIYALAGKKFNKEDKELLGNPFAQFIKGTAEIRYNYALGHKQYLVGRLMAGAIYSYGNARTSPYNEQFYIGGANSIRAFTIRSIGPGRYYQNSDNNKYAYIDRTGDLKFEANLEYRFPILGDLHGATFLDSGNIWLIRNDPDRPGGQLKWGSFLKDLALGTGFGLRYDLTFIVIRFDVGIGLHLPYDTGTGEVEPPKCAPSTGKKIAVLGGGPGGLSAAYYLQLMGHQTTVYEMLPKLGGMLRYGIPNYRLPKERLEDDVNAILKTGVQVEYGKKIGQDITIQDLREQYDAVLITIGASTDKKLGLEGEDAEGVMSAVQFLRNIGKNIITDLTGKEVAVIGGGNVSMDAVRTAKRLGAKKVSIVYRRRMADMTALPGEINGAVAEGIELQTLKAPAAIDVDENNHVKGIYVTPQMVSTIKNGRASVRPTGEDDIYIPCDVLVVAIGQNIETAHFEAAGIPVSRGKILTTSTGAVEDMPDVYAGGDCSSGPATVIKAIAAAKVVAANIDEYLGFRHEISCDVEIPEAKLEDKIPCGRIDLTEREACERVCDFDAVENCMTENEARQEAGRCLRCDHFGYGIFKGGRETLW